ncbi:MAG: FapA family protein [Clostridia bacterium]|jgi:uncharacterized protein (DUF342 family)|nr:FapA family protein [Clostridia bacterium]
METFENTSPDLFEDVEVIIEESAMKAYIKFVRHEKGIDSITLEYINQKLREAEIIYGLRSSDIEKAFGQKEFNIKYLVAEGTKPVKGDDGEIEYLFSVEKELTPKMLEDGTVDYHNLELIENVAPGDELAKITKATDGVNGIDVKNNTIIAQKGKEIKPAAGKNTTLTEDGLHIISNIEGQVLLVGDKITVNETHEISGNVDHSTGNIKFVGNVVIKGNVQTGFKVEAGGSVEVYGIVEGAEIIADGDIILDKGMQGVKKGILKSGGKIVAKFIENADIHCEGNLEVGSILHSNVISNSDILVLGKKGLISGGTFEARKMISAKTIGASLGTLTEIKVGFDHKLIDAFNALNDQILMYKKEVQKMDTAITGFKKMAEVGRLSDSKKPLLMQLVEQRNSYTSKIAESQAESEDLREKLNQKIDARINVQNVIYPGVQITIGKAFLHNNEENKYCTFQREGADIKVSQYRP